MAGLQSNRIAPGSSNAVRSVCHFEVTLEGNSMANRAMLAKVERANRQRREAAAAEFSKPAYATWRDGQAIGPADLAKMVRGFDGQIVKLAPGKASGLANSFGNEGKGKRRRFTRCYGNFKRVAPAFERGNAEQWLRTSEARQSVWPILVGR
jgi:hypothetical protein